MFPAQNGENVFDNKLILIVLSKQGISASWPGFPLQLAVPGLISRLCPRRRESRANFRSNPPSSSRHNPAKA